MLYYHVIKKEKYLLPIEDNAGHGTTTEKTLMNNCCFLCIFWIILFNYDCISGKLVFPRSFSINYSGICDEDHLSKRTFICPALRAVFLHTFYCSLSHMPILLVITFKLCKLKLLVHQIIMLTHFARKSIPIGMIPCSAESAGKLTLSTGCSIAEVTCGCTDGVWWGSPIRARRRIPRTIWALV